MLKVLIVIKRKREGNEEGGEEGRLSVTRSCPRAKGEQGVCFFPFSFFGRQRTDNADATKPKNK